MKRSIVFLLLLIVLLLPGCEGQMSSDFTSLPTGATEITDIGNGWVTFKHNGKKFMYHKSYAPHKGYEAITCVEGCQ